MESNGQVIFRKGDGYWSISKYPIGGNFRRATGDLLLENMQEMPDCIRGCKYTATVCSTGERIAFGAESMI